MAGEVLAYKPDVAFPALHGPGGEDGVIQGLFESLDIPYVGSGVAASALCMNKLYTKWAFESLGIPTPRWTLVEPFAPARNLPPFPAVAKPLTEGSSVGVEFVENEQALHAILERKKIPLLVEERIFGRELTLPVFGQPLDLLPIIEIRPKSRFFDFDAKYTKGMTEYICPAEVPSALRDQLQTYCAKLGRFLGLRHLSRIDVMLGSARPHATDAPLPGMSERGESGGIPYFLEINTLPGMTATSLLPMSARSAGMEFPELIDRLIEMAAGRAA